MKTLDLPEPIEADVFGVEIIRCVLRMIDARPASERLFFAKWPDGLTRPAVNSRTSKRKKEIPRKRLYHRCLQHIARRRGSLGAWLWCVAGWIKRK
jgi:hypothetical protein